MWLDVSLVHCLLRLDPPLCLFWESLVVSFSSDVERLESK